MKSTHKLWGVIATDGAYTSEFGVSLFIPPKLSLTDKTIATDAIEATIQDALAEYTTRKNNPTLYDAVNKSCSAFIKAAVDKVWYKELKDPVTVYTKVSAALFLTHLRDNCGGLHKINAITIQGEMMDIVNGVLHYRNMMEESQAQAQQANLPISDAVLVATSNRAMVATNDYPNETKSWSKLMPSKRTWLKWMPTYKEAYTTSQHSAVVQAEKVTPFGGLATKPGSVKEAQKPEVFK